jgi:hypothetical protein
VHYTPIETLLTILVVRYSDGYELRCRLPVNPNVRDILGFRYSRRVELLKYGITVYRHARGQQVSIVGWLTLVEDCDGSRLPVRGLPSSRNLDYQARIQAVALACPGVDYIRLWPLPVKQPWGDPTDSLPGWYAGRLGPAL